MKMSKRILICLVGASLSATAIASSIKDRLIDVAIIEPAKAMQLNVLPELITSPVEAPIALIKYINVNDIEILDYGGIDYRQVNSNKLAYRESNVLIVKFAKVQNKNFERMRLAS